MKINKDFKTGFLNGLGICLALVLCIGIVFGVNNIIQSKVVFGGQIKSKIDDNTVITEAEGKFYLETTDNVGRFGLTINTTNGTYTIGNFELGYREKVEISAFARSPNDYEHKSVVDVVYKLPETWIISTGIDRDVEIEYKNKTVQKRSRRDPTFYRGVDYPEEIPFDEIEITAEFISKYIDTNETEYYFFARVKESSDDFNINSMTIHSEINNKIRYE